MFDFSGKTILLGVTGGIAAYKAVELGRLLKKNGARVITVLTPSAKEFVSEMTFKAAVGAVYSNLFDKKNPMLHISLAKKADAVVIAPATANFISKICAGMADDLLTATILATKAPVFVAPAMNTGMYSNAITKKNLKTLSSSGFKVIQPSAGDLACGDVGKGRLVDPKTIAATVSTAFIEKDLTGKKILVTAGPTREFIDPVRFISSNSSGRMGYAIAESALARGAKVTLISGPTEIQAPQKATIVRVITAKEMFEKTLEKVHGFDVLIAAAAVSDYSPYRKEKQKIKKKGKRISIRLVQNPDVLLEASRKKHWVLVGFALETQNHLANALKKLKEKNLDLIVLNDASAAGATKSKCTLITRNRRIRLSNQPKEKTASKILDEVVNLLNAK